MTEWRMILAALVLAVCGNVRTSGESWLVGPRDDALLKGSPGKSIQSSMVVIADTQPPPSSYDGPVALSIMLPASPGVGQSVEALRFTQAVYYGHPVVQGWTDTYSDDDHLQTLQAGDGRIHWDGNAPESACLHQTRTGWEVCR